MLTGETSWTSVWQRLLAFVYTCLGHWSHTGAHVSAIRPDLFKLETHWNEVNIWLWNLCNVLMQDWKLCKQHISWAGVITVAHALMGQCCALTCNTTLLMCILTKSFSFCMWQLWMHRTSQALHSLKSLRFLLLNECCAAVSNTAQYPCGKYFIHVPKNSPES